NRCIDSTSAGIGQRVSIWMLRPLCPPELLETLPERRDLDLRVRVAFSISHQHANPPHPLALLRPRRQRPRGRATKQPDELAPLHSITSSASSCNALGTSMPSNLAVCALMTNSRSGFVASFPRPGGNATGFAVTEPTQA